MQLIFATHNQNKLKELQQLMPPSIVLQSLNDLAYTDAIDETGEDLAANALIKARTIYQHFGKPVFADDTGLEITTLGGAPGVHSARWAGPECDARANVQKILKQLDGQSRRDARFRTVIALIINDKEYLFEGSVAGHISKQPTGTEGFGYDPVFIPEGQQLSFAQMSAEAKNRISHRGRAVNRLLEFLNSTYEPLR